MADMRRSPIGTGNLERYPVFSRSTYRTGLEPPASVKQTCSNNYGRWAVSRYLLASASTSCAVPSAGPSAWPP